MSIVGPVMVLTRPPRPEKPAQGATRAEWKDFARACDEQDFKYCQGILDEGNVTMIVKEADVWHNMRPERLERLANGEVARLTAKAGKTCRYLGLSLTEVAGL